MRWIENISISAKILLSLGLLAVVSIGVAVKAIEALSTLNERTQSIVSTDARGLFLAMQMAETMGRIMERIAALTDEGGGLRFAVVDDSWRATYESGGLPLFDR